MNSCLEQLTNRQLRALASSLHLSLGADPNRRLWIERLSRHLLNDDYLQATFYGLDADAKRALLMLLDAGGEASHPAFADQFGEIRLWRPWQQNDDSAKPWIAVASPAEALFYRGLIYLCPRKPVPGTVQRVVIPTEIQKRLSALLSPENRKERGEDRRPGAPPDLRWHVVLFLATVAEQQRPLLHGNWLPPQMLQVLAHRLGLDDDPNFQMRRSERLLPYLAFVHWLALATGLVAHGSHLQLTPRAWQWLAVETDQQWRWLWKGFLSGNGETALRYDLTWAVIPAEGRIWLTSQLDRRLHPAPTASLEDVVTWLHLQDEREWLAQPWNLQEDVATMFLQEPLWWLQVISLLQDSQGGPAVCLTEMGRWLFGRKQDPPPFSRRREGYLDARDNTLIHVPLHVSPERLVRLTRYTTWADSDFPSYEVHLRLTEETLAMAAARGEALRQIAAAIEGMIGKPPSSRLQTKLRHWLKKGQQVRLRRLLVLETDSAALMGELRRRRRVLRNLGDVVGPSRSVVNPARLQALTQQLRTLGWYLKQVPADEALSRSENQGEIVITAAEAAFLLATAHMYQALGEFIQLPGHPPAGLLLQLAGELSPDQEAAAGYLADETLKRLGMLLHGYDGLPAWHAPQQAQNPLPIIRKALEAQQLLEISYWLPACGQALTRRVQPYFLEEHEQHHYLIGYCYLREDERVFRLDRILQAKIVEK